MTHCKNCSKQNDEDAIFCKNCATRLVVDEVICNLCGLSCRFDTKFSNDNYGLINQSVNCGYESTPGNGHGALDDITWYRFSLCEFCLDWLFAQFKVPVSTGCYAGGDGDDDTTQWRPAQERVNRDDWRKMKDVFQIEHDKRAKARSKKQG
jgi:hypothetical protein